MSKRYAHFVRRAQSLLAWSLVLIANPLSSTAQEEDRFLKNDSDILGFALSADGTQLATTDKHALKVWDVGTGKVLKQLAGVAGGTATGDMVQVFFSPDGKTIATCGYAGGVGESLTLWDLESGKRAATLTPETKKVRVVAFHPEGKLVAAGGWRDMGLWDQDRKPVRMLKLQSSCGRALFSPNGQILAVASGPIQLFEVQTGDPMAVLESYYKQMGTSSLGLAFSPDGKSIAVGGPNRSGHTGRPKDIPATKFAPIEIWDLESKSVRSMFISDVDGINSLAWSPDGTLLASCGFGSVTLWDVKTGKARKSFKETQTSDAQFTPDGKHLLGGTWTRRGTGMTFWRVPD